MLLEVKRWTLSWSLSYLTCFPCPTAKFKTGKFIHYAAGNGLGFCLLTPNFWEQKQRRIFSVSSWQSCWIKLFLKTKTQVYLDSKSWRAYFKTKWHLPFFQSVSQRTLRRFLLFLVKEESRLPRSCFHLLWEFKHLKGICIQLNSLFPHEWRLWMK